MNHSEIVSFLWGADIREIERDILRMLAEVTGSQP